MSHFSRMRTRIRDLETLKQTLRAMGYTDLREGGAIQGYRQQSTPVDLAVQMPAGYAVGFVRDEDGAYTLVADWWGVRGTSQQDFAARLEQELAELDRRVRQAYAVSTTLAQLQQQGYQVVEQRDEADGTVRIVARRWR